MSHKEETPRSTQAELAKRSAQVLSQLGVHVSIDDYVFGEATPEDIYHFVTDPVGFYASKYEVSPQVYLAWKQYTDGEGRCTGTTHKGKQCGRGGEYVDANGPWKFIPGQSDRCHCHKEGE